MSVLPKDRLMVLHNLSPENLDAALCFGGLPVPSLSVTKAATPYTGFGEISLIGTRFLVDPRQVPVYACDAFTASSPKARGGRTLFMETADMAVRRMISPAAQRRRGAYGTGRLLADAAGCFPNMEALQAARDQVVEASLALAHWKDMDDLLDHFVLGLAPCHHPLLPASAARRETSAMKALLTAYQHGAARQDLLDALARRRFFQIPPELMAVGLKILHRLPHMPTPYFEAKPRRLVSLREFTGAVAPRNLAYDLRKALRAAGLALRLFDPGEDGNAQATAVRAMAFRLAEEAGEWQASVTKAKILFSAPRARSTPVFPCRPKSGKPGDAPSRGGHAVILFTKHQMLRGRIPLTCEAVPHAV